MRRKRNQPWGSSVLDPRSRLTHGCSAASVIHICSLSGQFPQPRAFFSAHNNTSNELILLLWQRTGDLGHAALALCLPPPPFGHLKTCPHPAVLLHNLTLSFSGDFPQRYECGRLVCACVRVRRRACQRVWPNVWVRLCPLCLFIYLFIHLFVCW